MVTKKNRSYFKALLKSEEGEVLAEGDAAANIPEKTVTFRSNFVPLYPIGTPMTIVRLHDDTEIHKFTGKVYLSDKKLMRIVSVDDELLHGSEKLYCKNMNFFATVSSYFNIKETEKGFFKRYAKEKQQYKFFEVRINEINDEYLVFRLYDTSESENIAEEKSLDYLESDRPLFDIDIVEGQRLIINSQSKMPPLEDVTIEVITPFYFGTSPSFKCIFVDLNPEAKEALNSFLWEFNLVRNKLF